MHACLNWKELLKGSQSKGMAGDLLYILEVGGRKKKRNGGIIIETCI